MAIPSTSRRTERRRPWRRSARPARSCEPQLLCGCTAELLCDACALPTWGHLASTR